MLLTGEMKEQIKTTEGLAEVARIQFRAVLAGVESPVRFGLRQRLMDGRVDGEAYWRWRYGRGCVLGTIAFFDGAPDPVAEAMAHDLATVFALEEWAERVQPGDVPDHTAHEDSGPFRVAVLVSWIDELTKETNV